MPDLFSNGDHTQKTAVVSTQNSLPIPAEIAENTDYDFTSIRKAFYNGKWYFAYMDVISVLTDSAAPKKYAAKLKKQLIDEGFEWSTKCRLLTLKAGDGKNYRTSCFAQEDILRIIEEIPSPKAEPLKREIARLASERMEEIANPDLAIKRGYEGYIKKGYSPAFASRRAKSVIHRKALTEAWQSHGISTPREFALLTDRESKGVFGKSTGKMKRNRDLAPCQNLRDSMSLSEIAAQDMADTVIAALVEKNNPYGFDANAGEVDKGSAVGAQLLADLERVLEA